MKSKYWKMLLAFLISMSTAIVIAIIGGMFIATPEQIANKMSVAFYVPQAFAVQYLAPNDKTSTLLVFAALGSLGGVVGWFIYRSIVL